MSDNGETGVPLRIRTGIVYEPLFGYRAVQERNGERSYIGPWTTEDQAQRNADEETRITHEVIDGQGIARTKGDTPLGVWVPQNDGRGTTDQDEGRDGGSDGSA